MVDNKVGLNCLALLAIHYLSKHFSACTHIKYEPVIFVGRYFEVGTEQSMFSEESRFVHLCEWNKIQQHLLEYCFMDLLGFCRARFHVRLWRVPIMKGVFEHVIPRLLRAKFPGPYWHSGVTLGRRRSRCLRSSWYINETVLGLHVPFHGRCASLLRV